MYFFDKYFNDGKVVDSYWFYADPDMDPDPTFFIIADPVQIQGFDDQKLKKIYSWKFFIYQKLQFTYP